MVDPYGYIPEDVYMPPPPMPGSKSDQVYSAIIQERKIENVLEQLNPDKLIVEIEFRLKGYKKNQFTKTWELIGKEEKQVSDKLIVDCLSLLSSLLTNNTTLSNYSPDEINRIMQTIIRKLIDMIRENSHEYGLAENYAERDRVCLIILNSTFASLKRAQGGLESKRLFDSLDIKEGNSGMNQPQQKGVLGRLFNV